MRRTAALSLILLLVASAASPIIQTQPPAGHARASTSYDWCDCATGLSTVEVWPGDDRGQSVTVKMNETSTVSWSAPVDSIGWSCNGMKASGKASLGAKSLYWSVLLTRSKKEGFLHSCAANTGRLKWNTWESTSYATSVPFTSHAGLTSFHLFSRYSVRVTSAAGLPQTVMRA